MSLLSTVSNQMGMGIGSETLRLLQGDPATVVDPATTVIDPATVVDPATSVVDPATTVIDPAATVVDPATTVVDPAATVVDPAATVVDPAATVAEPSITDTTEPVAAGSIMCTAESDDYCINTFGPNNCCMNMTIV